MEELAYPSGMCEYCRRALDEHIWFRGGRWLPRPQCVVALGPVPPTPYKKPWDR